MSETTPEGLARLREGASLVLDAHQREDCREDCPCRGTCRLCGWATWPCPSAEVAIALPALTHALEAERAKVAAGLALADDLLAFDCEDDLVPSDVDVPDDFEHGVRDAGHRLRAALGATEGGGA